MALSVLGREFYTTLRSVGACVWPWLPERVVVVHIPCVLLFAVSSECRKERVCGLVAGAGRRCTYTVCTTTPPRSTRESRKEAVHRIDAARVCNAPLIRYMYVQRRPAPATRATHTLLHSEEMAKSHTRARTHSRVTKVSHTHSYTRRPAEPGGSAYGGGRRRVLTQWAVSK